MSNDHNISPAELERRLKEKKWESVQIKGLAAWLNSYLQRGDCGRIERVPEDLQDGVKLMHFIDLFTKEQNEKLTAAGKKPWEALPRWIEPPRSRIHQMENASKALRYITDVLGVKLVGIGAEDIVDGNLMLMLGLMWSSFRTLTLGRLSGEQNSGPSNSKPEDDLLKWISSMTEGYGVEATSWKTSFNDGRVWAALVDKFDPEYLDYSALDPSDKEGTLNLVFELAEKKLGIPRLFETADLLEGTPDERSVILYSSLFYHAWTTNEARIKLANEKRGLGTKMIDIKSKLAQEEEERQRVQRERDALRDESDRRERELSGEEARIKEIRAQLAALDAEKARLKKMLEEGVQARDQQVRDQVDDMKDKKSKMSDQLRKESAAVGDLTKQNVDLLNQNLELAKHLKKAFGIHPNAFGRVDTSVDVWGSRQGSLSSMSGALREHVNALHLLFKDIQDKATDTSEQASLNADRVAVVNMMDKACESAAEYKTGKAIDEGFSKQFKNRNNTMLEILKIHDAINETRETTEKHGYLMAQEGKRWKKKWFVLKNGILSYYNRKEDQDDSSTVEGEILLESTLASPLHLPSEPKTPWAITFSMTISKSELVVGMKTREERDEWLCATLGKIIYFQYLEVCTRNNLRPDLRFSAIFANRVFSTVQLEKIQLPAPVMEVLCNVLENHSETKTISLVSCEIDDTSVAAFAKVLEALPGLEALDLSRNRITSRGAKALIAGMKNNKDLVSVNLSHNQIEDDSIEALASLLSKNSDLSSVDLSHNYMKGAKLDSFAAALGSLKGLSSLELQHNKLGDEAATALAKILPAHPGITLVNLAKNRIGDAGAVALCKALHKNSTIQKLDLSHNSIGADGAAAVKDLLLVNRALTTATLAANSRVIGGPHLSGLASASDLSVPGFVVMSI